MGEKCVWIDNGAHVFSDTEKKKVQMCCCERMSNVINGWEKDVLPSMNQTKVLA